MKIRHRIPVDQLTKSAVLTPEYQAEVDRTMAKAEASWRRAQKRLEQAERRLHRAKTARPHGGPAHKRRVAELEALVELRRTELEQLHRQMVTTGAPSTSRGDKSHRHINLGGVL